MRFYVNDGPPWDGYPTPGAIPFFDSGWFGGFGPTGRSTFIFRAEADFPSGGLFIPADSMTWSVQFQGMGPTDTVGVDLYSPPTVGQGYPDYWQNGGG